MLKVAPKDRGETVTVLGHTSAVSVGEYVDAQGTWHQDARYGLQFKATSILLIPPSTLEGIERYLASGMVKGIGAHFAKRLVKHFGETVLDVIEKEPKRLLELAGIGPKRCQYIKKAWAEQKAIRSIMVFLHTHGVGTARAVLIYKVYGARAIERVKDNPYCLALDIRGIGFKTADQLAQKLGVAPEAPIRAQAGVRHVLQELCSFRHCAVAYDTLLESSVTLLDISAAVIEQAVAHELEQARLMEESIERVRCLFPKNLYQAERSCTYHIKRLAGGPLPWGTLNVTQSIASLEAKTGRVLSDSQQAALHTVLSHTLCVITGGPGVGKTTLVHSILAVVQSQDLKIALCAPTGRAAKRLSESTGLKAKTVHRLLAFSPATFSFVHDETHPLECDVLIVDEASMLDIFLFQHLLKALPDRTALMLVGDIDQLPSVGSGAVLSDLIDSGVIATVRLTEIFRQCQHQLKTDPFLLEPPNEN